MTVRLCNLATWQLRRRVAASAVLAMVACGDPKVDDTSTLPTAPPPGATTNNGSVAANISGEQFFGRLGVAGTIVEDRLSFSAYDGYTRQLTFTVGAPGPGSFETGGPYNPVVSLTETSGEDTRRWVSSTSAGFGSITLTFLSADKAVGHFSFALFPDSATVALGITTRRNVTAGTFDITVSR
jgi:hypothetical protein